mmetsp:Transcript_111786/g.316191  ORF Transcript_111786/g.316191 Transcript_111786/m.316191 type:complete len:243 (-) Transcript_111786:752-1480(-)
MGDPLHPPWQLGVKAICEHEQLCYQVPDDDVEHAVREDEPQEEAYGAHRGYVEAQHEVHQEHRPQVRRQVCHAVRSALPDADPYRSSEKGRDRVRDDPCGQGVQAPDALRGAPRVDLLRGRHGLEHGRHGPQRRGEEEQAHGLAEARLRLHGALLEPDEACSDANAEGLCDLVLRNVLVKVRNQLILQEDPDLHNEGVSLALDDVPAKPDVFAAQDEGRQPHFHAVGVHAVGDGRLHVFCGR